MSYAILSTGSNVNKKRDENDFNATPREVTHCLIRKYKNIIRMSDNHIYEPACGDGAFGVMTSLLVTNP